MNERTLEKLLRDLGQNLSIEDGEDKVQISCPLAKWTHEKGCDSHPSMSIDLSANPPTYICFTCKNKGRLSSLVGKYNQFSGSEVPVEKYFSKFEGLRPKETHKKAPQIAMPLPETLLENFLPYRECDLATRYLKKRKISLAVADEFRLKYDPERGAVVFPIYGNQGKFLGAVGRYTQGDLRYHNYFHTKMAATLGGLDKVTNPKRIFIAEGFFDLLSAYPWVSKLDGGVVCTWTSRMSAGQAALLMSYDATLYCVYDADEAGEGGWRSIKSYFGSISGNRIRRMVLPQGLDLNEITEGKFNTFYNESRKGRLL